MFDKLFSYSLTFKLIEGKKNVVADCFSCHCSQTLNQGFIPRQYVPAHNSECKKVAHWGEEVSKDVLNEARRDREDLGYLNLMENISNDVVPKLSQPDSMLRESQSEVLARLRFEMVGKNFIIGFVL